MEVKETGRSFDFARTCSYLGTVADKTPAHKNPGLIKYENALKESNSVGIAKYKVYSHRDIRTFGNMDVSHGIHGLEHQESLIMAHTRRKVQSREFILMPSPSDRIDPNNADAVYHFEKYVRMFVKNNFGDNFYWFADIQPDSHKNSRVHAHIVILNYNLRNSNAIAGGYYGIKPLRQSVDKTTKQFNAAFRDYKMSAPTITKADRTPTPIESRIIAVAKACQQNSLITSRAKFRAYMVKNGVISIYRRNRKHPERSGWKFKLKDKQRYYEKGARLSKVKGGSFLASKNLDAILSQNRKLRARINRRSEVYRPLTSAPYSAPTASSSASSISTYKTDNNASSLENRTNKEALKEQQLALLQQRQLELIRRKRTRVKKRAKARQQEKEKIYHERQYNEQLKRMAKINQRQHQRIVEQSEEIKSTSKSYTTAGQQSVSGNQQEWSRQERQSNASILTSVLTRFNQTCQRLKRLHIKAKALRLKRRIAKAIAKRIEKIRMNVILRIHQRQHQRQQKQDAERRRKRRRQWQREQGGPDIE